jgi:Na+-transporting methylmalonyl-CoA/oxaloacetate decarboxylase gamma subunit
MIKTAFLHGYGLALILMVLSMLLHQALKVISKIVRRFYNRKK